MRAAHTHATAVPSSSAAAGVASTAAAASSSASFSAGAAATPVSVHPITPQTWLILDQMREALTCSLWYQHDTNTRARE